MKQFTYTLSNDKKASLTALRNKWDNSCARYKLLIVKIFFLTNLILNYRKK